MSEKKLSVFKVDNGAVYWVAAYDELGAVEVWIKACRDEGSEEEAVDALQEGLFSIEHLDDEAADAISIHDENRYRPNEPHSHIVSALVIKNEASESCLIGCSEW